MVAERDCYMIEMLRNVHGEGHPALWYLILRGGHDLLPYREVLPIAGGDARKVSHVPDGVSDPLWLPDGSGLLVVSDIKWQPNQEIDQRNGAYPTDSRIWTGLMWRHWDDWRAGKRQPRLWYARDSSRSNRVCSREPGRDALPASGSSHRGLSWRFV